MLFFITLVAGLFACSNQNDENAFTREISQLKHYRSDQIRIRDPFILPDPKTKIYYLYGQMENSPEGEDQGVEVYQSIDLTNWYGPTPVFTIDDTFWAHRDVWAPEVHEYKGKYYLFVTFTDHELLEGKSLSPSNPPMNKRGTQILVSDTPKGPFKAFSNKAHTPAEWMALDGTLFVEEGVPYMVFCHEWAQIHDGSMELIQLSDDLSTTVGQPQTLFRASEALWVRSMKDVGLAMDGYVTDGPWFYRTKSGKLQMIWSSFGDHRYAIGIAESESGKIAGPWHQVAKPLFAEDGGHAMMFKSFEGELLLALHQPNSNPLERLNLFKVSEKNDSLILNEKWSANE